MNYWLHVHHLDERARALADRHYSRQSIGAREFCPPGNKIVLLGLNDDALWVSHRPDPKAGKAVAHRNDGFDYWDNPYFRNESNQRASDLIREALAITLYLWGVAELPPDGLHTFVNPRKVRPTMRHGIAIYGYCFEKAGFALFPTLTKARRLLRFVMTREQLLQIEPLRPLREQGRMFA